MTAGGVWGWGCAGSPSSTRLSQASFQYTRQPAWQPPCPLPSQRTPVRCTASSMRRIPLQVIVSHSLLARLATV